MNVRDFTFKNKDNDFSVVLLSNDKKAERVTNEHSIRSNFKSFLPVGLDLVKGEWEMSVDRMILPNRQNNAMKLRISTLANGNKIDEIDFTPGVYDDAYEVLDELINLGEQTEYYVDLIGENFLVGGYDSSTKKIHSFHRWFSLDMGLTLYRIFEGRQPLNIFDIWRSIIFAVDGPPSYDMWEYNGDIFIDPDIIFRTDSSTKLPSVDKNDIYLNLSSGNKVKVAFMQKFSWSNPNYKTYMWFSEHLAKILRLDDKVDYLSNYSDKQIIQPLNNGDKKGYLVVQRTQDTDSQGRGINYIESSNVYLQKLKRPIIEIKVDGDYFVMSSSFKIEFLNRDGEITYTIPQKTKFLKRNVRLNIDWDIKNLVEKDISMINLYIPSLRSTKPIYLKSEKEDNLFDINIHLPKGTETILYQSRKERQYYPLVQSRHHFIEILLKDPQTGLTPKFWYGFTLVVLHFRRAKRNWFEKF